MNEPKFAVGQWVRVKDSQKYLWDTNYKNANFLFKISNVSIGHFGNIGNFYNLEGVDTGQTSEYWFSEAWFEVSNVPSSFVLHGKQNKTLYVHVCLWCNEPVTRQDKGEYKGHWRHIQTQDPTNPVNYWTCFTTKTKDGYPHVCALGSYGTDVVEQDESDMVVHVVKGRKFKE